MAIPNALERRRMQLTGEAQPPQAPASLPEFDQQRKQALAQQKAAERSSTLALERERSRMGGFGAGAGIKLGQQVQQQIQEQTQNQIGQIGAQESAAIRAQQEADINRQFAASEAEKGRQFQAEQTKQQQEYQKGFFDVEQRFKEKIAAQDQSNKDALLKFEQDKFKADKETTAYNTIISALGLDDQREKLQMLNTLANDPNMPPAFAKGLQFYTQAFYEFENPNRGQPASQLDRIVSIPQSGTRYQALRDYLNQTPNLSAQDQQRIRQEMAKVSPTTSFTRR